jgi:type IV secretory pathway component VirB8
VKKNDRLLIVAGVSTIVAIFCLTVVAIHGPVELFQQEPYGTIGEVQCSPVFWVVLVVSFPLAVVAVLMLRLQAREGDGRVWFV